MRLDLPETGLVYPNQFIHLAEEQADASRVFYVEGFVEGRQSFAVKIVY